MATNQGGPIHAHRQARCPRRQHQALAHPFGLGIAHVEAAPLGNVVAFEHALVAVGRRLEGRHAGNQLDRHGPRRIPMDRQLQHRVGATHIGRLELAVGGHLAELGAVVEDASQAPGQVCKSPVRQPKSGLGQVARHGHQPAGPSLLPEAVMAQVGLDPRQTQWAVLGPHQAAHLQLGPALQLAGQQVGPKKTGSTGEQDRLPRRGHRWRAGNRQAPATAQLGFLAQIEVPVAFGTSAIATIAIGIP